MNVQKRNSIDLLVALVVVVVVALVVVVVVPVVVVVVRPTNEKEIESDQTKVDFDHSLRNMARIKAVIPARRRMIRMATKTQQ